MNDPLIKFLALIVSAVLSVISMFLIPMLEEFIFQKKLIGKSITVVIYFLDKDESFSTEGTVDRIIENEILVIKRKTQQSFKIPFSISKLKESKIDNYKTDFKVEYMISKLDSFNIQTGFY